MWGIPHNTPVVRISTNERNATRQRLIDAGKVEFAARGLAGARFDEIALAAGHAKGTIYNYFDSKEALFFTIVKDWCTQLLAGFVTANGVTAREQLLEIARLDVEIARKDLDLARVVINQLPGLVGDHRVGVETAIGPGIDLLTAVIVAGQERGEVLAGQSARTLARLFLNVLSAIEQEALASDSELGLDDVLPLVDGCFLRGLVQ